MRLSKAYARFYKSFNFDHARKLDDRVEKQPWEMFRDRFYPYVTVPLDPRITTIVGANESGKSHLLGVIRKAITGQGIEQRDLCRYSPFFGVAAGQRCWPHVGVAWDGLSADEAEAVAAAARASDTDFRHFLMFRETPTRLTLWLPGPDGQFASHELTAERTKQVERLLPLPFEIDSEVALPNSVPFSFLRDGGDAVEASYSRSKIEALLDALKAMRPVLTGGTATVQANAEAIAQHFGAFAAPLSQTKDTTEVRSLSLGRSLLLQLGEIDPESLDELSKAIDQRHDGYVNGLLEAVNRQLDRKLNFRRYWVQDRDFSLRVTTRDREIVFVISDRTGTSYTFSERSSGLRYFLSYLIQAQIHRPGSERESILLMDEPDTYLSAEAQQDLMRVFRDLAQPPDGAEAVQVIYVTHSPFLLDKNHSERIRVLEKGTGYDGTRIVPSVSRNHYEPLRSAFGAFVGESAFVGSVNLLVEGAADQIVLAGAANLIRASSPGIMEETLDLNRMVIVPSGSAREVGYTVYRIRGQGSDKPPVVVLLDGDAEGTGAKADFVGDPRLRKLIRPENILDLNQLGAEVEDWPADPSLEDLVPLPLAHRAVRIVIEEVSKFREGHAPEIELPALAAELAKGGPLLDAVNREVGRHGGRIDKLAFAKALVEACADTGSEIRPHIETFLDRMRVVFRAVNAAVRRATDDASNRKLEATVAERVALFKVDNPVHATREAAGVLLAQIETMLDGSAEAEAIQTAMIPIRRDHRLHEDPARRVDDHQHLIEQLEGLKHAGRTILERSHVPAPDGVPQPETPAARARPAKPGSAGPDAAPARPPARRRKGA